MNQVDERTVEVVWSPARQAKVEALALRLREGVSFVEADYPFAIHQS